jgi:hypothetical protein
MTWNIRAPNLSMGHFHTRAKSHDILRVLENPLKVVAWEREFQFRNWWALKLNVKWKWKLWWRAIYYPHQPNQGATSKDEDWQTTVVTLVFNISLFFLERNEASISLPKTKHTRPPLTRSKKHNNVPRVHPTEPNNTTKSKRPKAWSTKGHLTLDFEDPWHVRQIMWLVKKLE